ncbi:leukemia NUP98 fusion partner 1 isoform X2 [Felis catus]|uniref:Leukemia NUP98 fusion partner 1 n=1 Tax=Felis catus TaxID=9685 RepID=A0ABI7X7Z8_FELCA|nr:leukemia NUP98 fusion partner 1 isoform X2 [Felis catus]
MREDSETVMDHKLPVTGKPPCPAQIPAVENTFSTFCLCQPQKQFPVLPRITSSDSHPRRHSHEDQGFRCHTHMRDYRKCSADESFKEPLESKGRSHSKIQAFSESFEQQLCFRTRRSVSLGPESRKERNERECLRMEIKSRKKMEERRKSRKEEHREEYTPSLFEKEPK